MANNKQNDNYNRDFRKGFAAMSYERLGAIASKGGHTSAARAGHEGMVARGSKGGQIAAARAGSEGMAERGRKGGYASAESRQRKAAEKTKAG